jgi:hypothetical protein
MKFHKAQRLQKVKPSALGTALSSRGAALSSPPEAPRPAPYSGAHRARCSYEVDPSNIRVPPRPGKPPVRREAATDGRLGYRRATPHQRTRAACPTKCLCRPAAANCSQSLPGRITRLIVSTLRSSMMTGAAGATRGATIARAERQPAPLASRSRSRSCAAGGRPTSRSSSRSNSILSSISKLRRGSASRSRQPSSPAPTR